MTSITGRDTEPTKNQPTKNQPTENQPTRNQPTENQPTENQPTRNQPTRNESPKDEPAAAPAKMTRRQVLVALSGLLIGMFVTILSATVVSNALPRIVSDLNGSQSSYTWVVTAELLAMTATVPIWGKLSDRMSKKLLVQVSLVLYVIGSAGAGMSHNVDTLIGMRVVQGIGVGGLTALAQVVLAAMIPPRELGRYAGYLGAVFGVGTVIGPLIGGVLVDTSWLGWRWCFYVGVPFAIVSLVLLQRTLNLPVTRSDKPIDYLGATLIAAGVSALLIWSTLAGNQFDWVSGWSAILVIGGLAMLAMAVLVESRAKDPIVPLGLFRNRTVTVAVLSSLFVGLAMFGGSVFLAQYFQVSLGKSPTVAGLLSLPMIVGLMGASIVSGQIISNIGRYKPFLLIGAVLVPLGSLLLGFIDENTSLWLTGAFMFVLGAGVGLLMQNLVLAVQNDVDPTQIGSATSVVAFFRSLGGAIGVSVLGAVLANRVTGYVETGLAELPPDQQPPAAGGGHSAVPNVAQLPEPIAAVFEHAYGSATGEIFLVSVPFAVLAGVIVLFIRESTLHTTTATERAEAQRSAVALH
jgi:EmrB/QacA subfamily drug resistance transporter